jgi:hypothetical protein
LNNLSVSLCGDASILSFHYERLRFIGPSVFLTGDLGIGFNQATLRYLFGYPCSPEYYFISLPHHITTNVGKRIHFFEFGIGGSLIFLDTEHDYFSTVITDRNYFIYPVFGYRIQPLQSNRMHFRIYGIIPFSGYDHGEIHFSPLGISLGISL